MVARLARQVRQQYAGFLALFVALGGVSYAAVTLPANSVGSKQVKPGAVKTSDLSTGAVTSSKVKDGSLLARDFKPGQLGDGGPGKTGAPGAVGPQGPQGSRGDEGAPGTPADTNGFVQGSGQLLSTRIVVAPTGSRQTLLDIPGLGVLTATCGAGEAAIAYRNGTGGPIDLFIGDTFGDTVQSTTSTFYSITSGRNAAGSSTSKTVSLGVGATPGPRRVATLRVSSLQLADDTNCAFQVQGTLWTAP